MHINGRNENEGQNGEAGEKARGNEDPWSANTWPPQGEPSVANDTDARREGIKRPPIGIPKIIIVLSLLFIVIHGLRYWLSADQDYLLIFFGAFNPAYFSIDVIGHLYTLLTYNFLHGDFQHLMFNSLWFVIFGTAVARRIPALPFMLFFIMTAIAGALTYLLFNGPQLISVIGASAGIAGLMGAVVRFMFNPVNNVSGQPELFSLSEAFRNRTVVIFIVIWLIINYVVGTDILPMTGSVNSIAWEAHLGGFFMGFLCYGFFERSG